MADVHEKDYGHTGSFNPNYPTASSQGDDGRHNGTLNPNYPSTNGNSHLDGSHDPDHALRKIRTAGSISISPELFEKIYLSPQNNVKGDLRKTFANPTPLALLGFLLSLSPLSCDLMGWRGAGGNGIASIGAYYFMGGLLMIIGGVLEFFLGNTFPFVVFCSFGGYWLTFATTLNAAYGAQGAAFPQSFAFFLVFMGVLCFVYLIASLRTNIMFFIIFLTLVIAFFLLSGAYWNLAKGTPAAEAHAGKLQIVAGAFLFITCMAGWWIFLAQMLASVDFPVQIPVFDISHIIKPASAKLKEKDDQYTA
ncbi:MAG: hypothetical protein LQ347_000574 [Umbilicaria vellea]|nr:MAG: hypothetical protein LQ347_000574 [Umbilicaria vellea]